VQNRWTSWTGRKRRMQTGRPPQSQTPPRPPLPTTPRLTGLTRQLEGGWQTRRQLNRHLWKRHQLNQHQLNQHQLNQHQLNQHQWKRHNLKPNQQKRRLNTVLVLVHARNKSIADLSVPVRITTEMETLSRTENTHPENTRTNTTNNTRLRRKRKQLSMSKNYSETSSLTLRKTPPCKKSFEKPSLS